MKNINPVQGFLPQVKIKNIILEDPSQAPSTLTKSQRKGVRTINPLTVNVRTSTITNYGGIDNKYNISTAEFNKHLRIAIIQSRDASLSSLIEKLGDEILMYINPSNNWQGVGTRFDDLFFTNVTTHRQMGARAASKFRKSMMEVQVSSLFGQTTTPILEKTDGDGNEIRSVPNDFFFTIANQRPPHLSYFAFCYIDFDSLAQSVGISTINSLKGVGSPSTPLFMERVFIDGVVPTRTVFFKTLDGNVWTGPVHKMRDGRYMTGKSHQRSSAYLTSTTTNNVKVVDFRNNHLMKEINVMGDFTNEPQKNSINGDSNFDPRGRNAIEKYGLKTDPAYISDLFLSVSTNNSVKFMFMVNMDDLLTTNSYFKNVVKTDNKGLRQEIMARSRITSMRVYREEVEKSVGVNKIGSPTETYSRMGGTEEKLLDMSSQPKTKKYLKNTKALSEERKMSYSANTSIRCFNVDDSITSLGGVKYKYRVEMDILDGTFDYFKEKELELRRLVTVLKNYVTTLDASIVKEDGPTAGELWQTPTSLATTKELGGYDPNLDSLTPNFAIAMSNKYSADVRMGIENFIKILKLFIGSSIFNMDFERKLSNFLGIMTDPSQVNPANILVLLETVEQVADRISPHVLKDRAGNPAAKKAQNIISSSNANEKLIFINKSFNNIADLSRYNVGAYEYLSLTGPQAVKSGSGSRGLRFLSGADFRRRAEKETLRYFSSTTPDIRGGMTGGNPGRAYAGSDNVRNSLLTFFAPSTIRNNAVMDLMSGPGFDNNGLFRELITRLAVSEGYKKTEGAPIPLRAGRTNVLAPRPQGSAPAEQVQYLAEKFSFVPTPPHRISAHSDSGASAGANLTLADAQDQISPEEYSSTTAAVGGSSQLSANSTPAPIYQTLFDSAVTGIPMGGRVFSALSSNQFDLNGRNYLQDATTAQVQALPNQIKELFMRTSATSNELRGDSTGIDVRNAAGTMYSSVMKYMLLSRVEYCVGFPVATIGSRNTFLMNRSAWAPLSVAIFSQLLGKRILCRFRKFEMRGWGIERPQNMDFPTIDEYFIMEPDVPFLAMGQGADQEHALAVALAKDNEAPAGFGPKDGSYSTCREFGRSHTVGMSNLSIINSNDFKWIMGELRQYASYINSNFTADDFLTNGTAINSKGKRTYGKDREIWKGSQMYKKIASMKKNKINSALKEAIGDIASPNRSSGANVAVYSRMGKIPDLRESLVEVRTQMSILKAHRSGLQNKIDQLANLHSKMKDRATRKLPDNPAAKNSIAGITDMQSSNISSAEDQKKTVVRKINALQRKESAVLANINNEMAKVQKRLIDQRGAPITDSNSPFMQSRQEDITHRSTRNLRTSFEMDLDRISLKRYFVEPKDIEKLLFYKNYILYDKLPLFDHMIDKLKDFLRTKNMFIHEPAYITSDQGSLDMLREVQGKGFNYSFVRQQAQLFKDQMMQGGMHEVYIKDAVLELTKRLVSATQLSPQSYTVAVKSIITSLYPEMN